MWAEQPLDTPTLISGRWNVLKDSLYNDGNFYIIPEGVPNYPLPGVYFGTPADYYNFNVNGNVYIEENIYTDTSSYEFWPNNKLSISIFSVYYPPAGIQMLTANNAIFYWTATSPNGGQYARTLYLTK